MSQGQGNPDPGAQSVGVQGEGREGGKVAVGIQQAGGEGRIRTRPHEGLETAIVVKADGDREARLRVEGRHEARARSSGE